MAYVAAADFRTKSQKAWTQGLTLDESVADTYLDTVIAQVEFHVNATTSDDFEPAGGDPDVTLEVSGSGTSRLYLPRRCRSITTLKTRSPAGTLTTEATANWRLRSSLNAAGTEMLDNATLDWIDVVQPLSVGSRWPEGWPSVQIVGKFGWASCPNEIKRVVALLVYDILKKPSAQRRVQTFETRDVRYTPLPEDGDASGIAEVDRILTRYRRGAVLVR